MSEFGDSWLYCHLASVMCNPCLLNSNVRSLRYGFVVRSGSELNCQVIMNFYWQSVSRDDVDKVRILLELLFVRLGNFRLSNFDVHSLLLYVLSRPSGLCG